MSREAMQMALEAMQDAHNLLPGMYDKHIVGIKQRHFDAIAALRAALEAQQEPVIVGWRPAIKCAPPQNFNAGAPREADVAYWKAQGCGIEYAYAAPPTRKPLSDKDQPNNETCWALGEACRKAADDPKCGDYIDRGLILLRELEAKGYGIVSLHGDAP